MDDRIIRLNTGRRRVRLNTGRRRIRLNARRRRCSSRSHLILVKLLFQGLPVSLVELTLVVLEAAVTSGGRAVVGLVVGMMMAEVVRIIWNIVFAGCAGCVATYKVSFKLKFEFSTMDCGEKQTLFLITFLKLAF